MSGFSSVPEGLLASEEGLIFAVLSELERSKSIPSQIRVANT